MKPGDMILVLDEHVLLARYDEIRSRTKTKHYDNSEGGVVLILAEKFGADGTRDCEWKALDQDGDFVVIRDRWVRLDCEKVK